MRCYTYVVCSNISQVFLTTNPECAVSYEKRIHRGMQNLYERIENERHEIDLDSTRWIIFSDHHRGQRDGADDFQRCEPAYHAALGYYFETGHRLILLGDVEELWESRPAPVVKSYAGALELEAAFFDEGRYERYVGNHDDEWESSRAVKRFLGGRCPGLEIVEGRCFRVMSRGEELGTLLLTHGHQGLYWADKFRVLSRVLNRNFWRPIQRLTRIPSTTPARNFLLRNKHDRAMCSWAARYDRLALIAGHTHRPVFMGSSHQQRVERELERTLSEARREAAPADSLRVAQLRAELEWARVHGEDWTNAARELEAPKPCYFNSGACSFADGSITGLEIIDGEIRLVHWPNEAGEPRPRILATADLKNEVFAKL